MRRGGVIALMTLTAAALIAVNALVYLSADRRGPEIKLPLGLDTYYVSSGQSSLLEGVTATDNRDGDVSDSLRVASILPNSDNTQVTVTYTAKDSSNNVTKMSTTLAYDVSSAQTEEVLTDEEDEIVEAGDESVVTTEPVPDQNELEAAATQSDTEAMEALLDAAPRFYLTTHYATLSVGEEWRYYDYIADMTDDRDTKSRLSGTIQISGTVDTSTPGTYEVTYHVTDSSGYDSNYATLTVTVQ